MHHEDGFAAEDRRPSRGDCAALVQAAAPQASPSPSSSRQSSRLSSLLWIYVLFESFVTDDKIFDEYPSCSTHLEIF